MTAFPGFGLSGYRSLSGEAQWIPLGDDATVFLGGNNSGKSNVMRLVHAHMDGLVASITGAQQIDSFDAQMDTPRGTQRSGLGVHWPFDREESVDADRFNNVRRKLERVLDLPELN